MNRHASIRELLYDYVRGDIAPDQRLSIEQHLAVCPSCAEDVKTIRSLIAAVTPSLQQPSEQLPSEYWTTFVDNVEARLRSRHPAKEQVFEQLTQWIETAFTFRKPYVVMSGALCLGIFIGVVIFMPTAKEAQKPDLSLQQAQEESPTETTQAIVVADRARQYFRKSKVLLVGLTNMKLNVSQPIDLSVEQAHSRELIHEARFLKYAGLDNRSTKLVNDLEKILIELANLEQHGDLPNVELIRSGIHQENLLFKIRMAESLFDTANMISADQGH
jgi:hypothetical protein